MPQGTPTTRSFIRSPMQTRESSTQISTLMINKRVEKGSRGKLMMGNFASFMITFKPPECD